MCMNPLIEVKDMSVYFRQRNRKITAVDSVSFCLFPNEILGIVGESGSGKSTIARALTRLIDVSSGKIFLDGKDITHITGRKLREIYRRIQMVFQFPSDSFDPSMTFLESIGESLKNAGFDKGQIKKSVYQLLDQCGLSEDFADRYPYEVSGGQCQRAAVARALSVQPDILICDEVTSSLDMTTQKQIIKLLLDMKKKHGMACLFISHDLALVQNFCDRIIVIHNGRIVEQGFPDDLIIHPQDEYTKMLIRAAEFFE